MTDNEKLTQYTRELRKIIRAREKRLISETQSEERILKLNEKYYKLRD